ncbi:hypothetical protein I4U23_011160 [Adineta vaga]|nr:hypothetical protein I4U23_011160 [Adineta vaga]
MRDIISNPVKYQLDTITSIKFSHRLNTEHHKMINILSRSILLSFLIINILIIDYVKCAVNWNGNNWAMQCDFSGNDLSNVKIAGELCGGKCAETTGCTHFTWTDHQGGTCWMKYGAVSKNNAFSTNDPNVVCGIMEGGHQGGSGSNINWNGNNWAVQCDFSGNDLSNVKIAGELCGGKCAETTGCTHFTWTDHQGGTCWMKYGAVSKNNAFSTNDPSMVCGVLGDNTVGGGSSSGDIINEQTFACAFNTIDAGMRASRFNGLRESGWTPANKDEAAVFLAHVFHETDGLKTMREYCAPGCASNYAGSWCGIQGKPGKLYYGRGWFQLSWPCNYHAAGQALGVDLLSNPDVVEQQPSLAVRTAVWFYQTNKMDEPARRGDFAATTRIINGKLECNGGPGAANQGLRIDTYKRIRKCFGLGEPTISPWC